MNKNKKVASLKLFSLSPPIFLRLLTIISWPLISSLLMHPHQLHHFLRPLSLFSQVYSMKFLVVTLGCLLLLASTIDCKKIKNEKTNKGKEVRREKREVERPKEIVKEIIVEKFVQPPQHRHAEEVEEGHQQQHFHADSHHHNEGVQEHFVEHVVQPKIVKPKTLRVLSAYEQCKAECRKQRDSVHAHDYVQHLRDELAAAEAALAEEKRLAEHDAESAHEPEIAH